jgi:hypothetical protein
MKKTINALTNRLQKLHVVSHFLNGIPGPDFNVKGCFCDLEFIEDMEPHMEPMKIGPTIFIEPHITDLRLLFPA